MININKWKFLRILNYNLWWLLLEGNLLLRIINYYIINILVVAIVGKLLL